MFNIDDLNIDGLDLSGLNIGAEGEEAVSVAEIKESIKEAAVETNTQEEVTGEEVAEQTTMPSFEDFINQVDPKNNKKDTKKENKADKKKSTSDKSKEANNKVTGPRIVKVYGEELWVEEDVNVTNEEIRQRIVNEFGYTEFNPEKTVFDYDSKAGVLDVGKIFNKKG